MDHTNRIREALENGEQLLGARVKTRSPMLVEVYGKIALDFVWLDFEHAGSPYDSSEYEELARAAQATNIEPLVRIPTSNPSLIRRVLDAGIRSILVPRVETAVEVQRAIKASRFIYDDDVGERGVASGRPSDWGASFDGYVEREDDQVLVGVMIENRNALANLEEILSIPDLGFIFIGPSDLSVSLGHPLEKDHPDVLEAIDTIKNTCLDHGVPVGRIKNDKLGIEQALEEGYQILRIGDEVGAVREIFSRRLPSTKTR